MKKVALGLIILVIAAGFLLRAVFPYYNAFLMDGIVKSIDFNPATEEAECIMVDEETGKIVEFKATGKRWKIVEVNNCIQVKMYPVMIPTKAGSYKMVAIEKILDCDEMRKENKEELEAGSQSEDHQNHQERHEGDQPQEENNNERKNNDALKEKVLESGESVEI